MVRKESNHQLKIHIHTKEIKWIHEYEIFVPFPVSTFQHTYRCTETNYVPTIKYLQFQMGVFMWQHIHKIDFNISATVDSVEVENSELLDQSFSFPNELQLLLRIMPRNGIVLTSQLATSLLELKRLWPGAPHLLTW